MRILGFLSTLETKVVATGVGASAGATVGAAVDWALGVYWQGVPDDAGHAAQAVAAVPAPISGAIALGLLFVGGIFFGYQAPPSNHAGNNATGEPMDDAAAGHPAPPLPLPDDTGPANLEGLDLPDAGEVTIQEIFFALGSLAFLLYIAVTAYNQLH